MKKNKFFIPTLFFINLYMAMLYPEGRMIILDFQLPPQEVLKSVQEELYEKKRQKKMGKWGRGDPEKASQRLLKTVNIQNILPSQEGILLLYGGYYQFSSATGVVSFPLKHDPKTIKIVVTPTIQLNPLYKNTIGGISTPTQTKDAPSTGMLYAFTPDEEKNSNTTTKQIWHITRTELSPNQPIDPTALIIIAPESTLCIPGTSTEKHGTTNFFLPPIYLTSRIGMNKTLVKNLGILQYFEPITLAKNQSENNSTAQTIPEND